jgi:hypothetical protein
MKKLIAIAAVAALSACSQQAEEAPAPAETTEAAVAPAPEDPTGTYDVKMADGTMGKTTINADGTYVDVGPDGTEERGTFTRANGQDCFDPDGDDPAVCWTVSQPAADGTFTATTVDGATTVTVTRAADAATAAPAPTPAT